MPRRPSVAEAPPELDGDFTPADIAAELKQLKFHDNEFSAIKIDKPVRDFLLASLSRHTARRT